MEGKEEAKRDSIKGHATRKFRHFSNSRRSILSVGSSWLHSTLPFLIHSYFFFFWDFSDSEKVGKGESEGKLGNLIFSSRLHSWHLTMMKRKSKESWRKLFLFHKNNFLKRETGCSWVSNFALFTHSITHHTLPLLRFWNRFMIISFACISGLLIPPYYTWNLKKHSLDIWVILANIHNKKI